MFYSRELNALRIYGRSRLDMFNCSLHYITLVLVLLYFDIDRLLVPRSEQLFDIVEHVLTVIYINTPV